VTCEHAIGDAVRTGEEIFGGMGIDGNACVRFMMSTAEQEGMRRVVNQRNSADFGDAANAFVAAAAGRWAEVQATAFRHAAAAAVNAAAYAAAMEVHAEDALRQLRRLARTRAKLLEMPQMPPTLPVQALDEALPPEHVVDVLTVYQCNVAVLPTFDKVPDTHRVRWGRLCARTWRKVRVSTAVRKHREELRGACEQAHAVSALNTADPIALAQSAQSLQQAVTGVALAELDESRALKWYKVMWQLVLRKPPSGGRKGGADIVGTRLTMWEQGDMVGLVKWLLEDRAKASDWQRLRSSRSTRGGVFARRLDTLEKLTEEAMELLAEGEMSKAVDRICSLGVCDSRAEKVREQLEKLHPKRQGLMPSPEDFPPLPEESRISLGGKVREKAGQLNRKSGVGPDSGRNSHIRCLTQVFDDQEADTALEELEHIGELYVNAEFPAWFYQIEMAGRLIALAKNVPEDPNEEPDARPIGVGNVTRRLFHRIVATDFASAAAEVLAPYQVAMGTQGAAAQLVFGVREVLERFHELGGHKMDQKNAFNKFRRCECGELLEAFEKLKPLRPLVVKCLGPIAALVLDGACEGDLIAPFGSEEGGQQGDPLTCLLFCVWFHSHLAFAERFLRGAATTG